MPRRMGARRGRALLLREGVPGVCRARGPEGGRERHPREGRAAHRVGRRRLRLHDPAPRSLHRPGRERRVQLQRPRRGRVAQRAQGGGVPRVLLGGGEARGAGARAGGRLGRGVRAEGDDPASRSDVRAQESGVAGGVHRLVRLGRQRRQRRALPRVLHDGRSHTRASGRRWHGRRRHRAQNSKGSDCAGGQLHEQLRQQPACQARGLHRLAHQAVRFGLPHGLRPRHVGRRPSDAGAAEGQHAQALQRHHCGCLPRGHDERCAEWKGQLSGRVLPILREGWVEWRGRPQGRRERLRFILQVARAKDWHVRRGVRCVTSMPRQVACPPFRIKQSVA
mmetsp:Transcript_90489/g.235623  ORF Transcript_90489/g.235623 Transcript_90489/m.235623 type:complete len:336 (-) Transcript_90489:114-1121(-)